MAMEIHDLVNSFARALVKLDHEGGAQNPSWEGVGTLGEKQVVNGILGMAGNGRWGELFGGFPAPVVPKNLECDLVIPGEWALEVNLVRMPTGPKHCDPELKIEVGYGIPLYADASNPLGDCLKLSHSRFLERKAVLVYGFTRGKKGLTLLTEAKAMEVVAEYVLSVKLGARHYARTEKLRNPLYRYAEVFGWEVEKAGKIEAFSHLAAPALTVTLPR